MDRTVLGERHDVLAVTVHRILQQTQDAWQPARSWADVCETPETFGTHDDLVTCGFAPIGCNSRGLRHCWVTGPAGRCPGLLVEWAQRRDDRQAGADPRAGWFGRVVYAVVDDGQVVLVESWVPAGQLEPTAE